MADHLLAALFALLNIVAYSVAILLLVGCATVATPAQPTAYQRCQPPPGAVAVWCW